MSTGVVTEQPEALLPRAKPARRSSALWQGAALGAIALGSCAHLLIKVGVTTAAHSVTGVSLLGRIEQYFLQPAALFGLAIYAAGTSLWIYAVSQRNISFLYPLTALTYVIVALGGKFMLEELIPPGRWLGIGVVMIGVALLQFSAKEETT
jgi:drug/metabolite transporter (DMT)-like permease